MTLSTPQIYSVNAFDPSYSYSFNFSYSGTQAEANRAIIIDNETQTEVYNVKQDGLKLSHILPANTLQSGKSYLIQIQVYDANDNSSDLSDAVLFYCFKTPILRFLNLQGGDVITSANYELELAYTQPEGEVLNEYRYYLYDITKKLVYSSDSYYTDADMKHTIYGLKNETAYYVRAIGKTTHGMDADTGLVEIIIKYSNVVSNFGFEAINDKNTGCIILKTNIITVNFSIENENYTITNGTVDLKNNTLIYQVSIPSEFCMALKAIRLPMGTFCYSEFGNSKMFLSVKYIANKYYCHLLVKQDDIEYNLYKLLPDTAAIENGDVIVADKDGNKKTIAIEIYRENNLYDMNVIYM